MKLTNGQIFVAGQALPKLMGQKLPVMVSSRLIRLAQEIDIHLSVINAVRTNLVTQHSIEKDDKGEPIIKFNTPEMEAFSKDWSELLAEEIDVKFEGEKIKLPWTAEIEPTALLALDMFIEIPEK